MKSCGVTIQMKALCLYFHKMLFVCQNCENEILKFARNLPLAKFGSERVKKILCSLALALNVSLPFGYVLLKRVWFSGSCVSNNIIQD